MSCLYVFVRPPLAVDPPLLGCPSVVLPAVDPLVDHPSVHLPRLFPRSLPWDQASLSWSLWAARSSAEPPSRRCPLAPLIGESQGLTIHTDRSRFNVTAGGDATFSVRPSVKLRSGNWGFKDKTIVTWVGSSVDVDNAFTSRAELLLPNGSLLLKSVTRSDSGDYTVNMIPDVGDQQTATIALLVIGESQGLTIHTDRSRFNVTAGGDATFSVRPSVKVRSGNWGFKDKTIVTWIGSSVDVDNAVTSRAELLLPNGSLLLKSVTTSDSGNYTVTMVPEVGDMQTATIALLVIEPVSNVTVTLNNSNPVEDKDTILLTCDAQGTVQTWMWFKNDQPIQANDRILISPVSRHLTISHVNRNDTGTYKCTVGNDVSKSSAETIVKVNYGPENIRIEPQGPVVADIGSRVTVTCSALSVPIGEFFWFLGTNKLQSGQAFTIRSLQAVDRGNYTCQVKNSRTKKSMNQIVEITLRERLSPGGLSAGAIAGIAIGVIGGAAMVCGLVVWFVRNNMNRRAPPGRRAAEITAGRNNALTTDAESTSQTYENIPRKNKPTPPPDESSTYMGLNLEDRSVYSDLKR
ncbi:pregnancy-specific beta-1-glycoprotein 4-like isoform X2 [Narcine bancroftii]|uniref:pregnancy-specific beta-1-glycoprotein 4-like isoform X2 n=1 Tax=Narcine bancroftii TaxID=1343680 RepID=UPI0038322EFE